jgi:hypothetical protein
VSSSMVASAITEVAKSARAWRESAENNILSDLRSNLILKVIQDEKYFFVE